MTGRLLTSPHGKTEGSVTLDYTRTRDSVECWARCDILGPAGVSMAADFLQADIKALRCLQHPGPIELVRKVQAADERVKSLTSVAGHSDNPQSSVDITMARGLHDTLLVWRGARTKADASVATPRR